MRTFYTQEEVNAEPRVKVPQDPALRGKPLPTGQEIPFKWALARSENAKALGWRIRAAWRVFKGEAVPLEWY